MSAPALSSPLLHSSSYALGPETFQNLIDQVMESRYDLIKEGCALQSLQARVNAFHYLCRWKPNEEGEAAKIIEAIKIYLTSGIDPNFPKQNRKTALHIACAKGNLEVVKLLLENGADRNAKDYRDRTPLDVARDKKFEPIIQALEDEDLIFINGISVPQLLRLLGESLEAVALAQEIKATFVTGESGAGKTTLLNWIFGCDYVPGFNEGMEPELIASGQEVIPRGTNTRSDTVSVKTYKRLSSPHAYFDGPGYFDNRGSEYEMSASVAFSDLFKSGSVKSLLFVLPAGCFTESRLEKLRKVCSRLGSMIAIITRSLHLSFLS